MQQNLTFFCNSATKMSKRFHKRYERMFYFVLILYCGCGIVMIGISAACFCGWEEMTMEYREKIIEMVNAIDCEDILEYLYIFIRGKIGCFQNEENK